jgi:hypothetical protein
MDIYMIQIILNEIDSNVSKFFLDYNNFNDQELLLESYKKIYDTYRKNLGGKNNIIDVHEYPKILKRMMVNICKQLNIEYKN